MLTTNIPDYQIPANEVKRLSSLAAYDILDTPAEEAFDKIARLARQVFNVPYSFITFVDSDRVFYKSNCSTLEKNTLPREDSLCSIALLNNEVTVFTDTLDHEKLLSNPHVNGENGLRFYAGAPLKTADGYHLGVLCVADREPRLVASRQIDMLKTLATLVVDELEYHKLDKEKKSATRMLQSRLQQPVQHIQAAATEIEECLPDGSPLKKQAETLKLALGEVSRILENA
jgi:GAF domain-containing protein